MSLELLAIWSQIVGAAIFLVVIVLIWNKWVAPGVKAYQAAKNAELAEAESRRERMRADLAAARNEIERADSDVREIHGRIDLAVTRDRAKMLADAKAEAERIVRNAEGELERARHAARDRLRVEFIEKALIKARADAGGRVDDAANTRLIERTVDDVARGKA